MGKERRRCDDKGSQSPIDLGSQRQSGKSFWKTNTSDANDVIYSNNKMDGLRFDYGKTEAKLQNEGLFLKVNFTGGHATFLEAGHNEKLHWRHNRYVGGMYNLTHAHIHSPSEHTIKGKRYPMEIQLYHKNSRGHVVAVAVLLKFGFKNDFLTSLFSTSIPLSCAASPTLKLTPGDVFPLSMGYYAYEGSETQPPCIRISWYVMKDQATLSLFQYIDHAKTLGLQEKYRMHCSRYGCTKTPVVNGAEFPFSKVLEGNVRPLQPQGSRRIRATVIPASEQVATTKSDEDVTMHPLDKFKYPEVRPGW